MAIMRAKDIALVHKRPATRFGQRWGEKSEKKVKGEEYEGLLVIIFRLSNPRITGMITLTRL